MRAKSAIAILLAASLAIPACSSPDTPNPPVYCGAITAAVSPEKAELFTKLKTAFEKTGEDQKPGCINVFVSQVASGEAARLLQGNWKNTETGLPKPTIWSPAAAGWLGVANDRTDGKAIAPADASVSFARTPLVYAMPQVMAEALGWPKRPIGYAQLHALATDPRGWGSVNHPEWGAFKLGKTNPHYSTSGLNALLSEYYATSGKRKDLVEADVAAGKQSAREFEASAVHYGPTTLTFLNNWYERDRNGEALTYVSAVAVEEKSVIDYNSGNPDGIVSEGENIKPPNEPLVAIYPEEGSPVSDNPLVIVDAPWVTAEQKLVAKAFQEFALKPEQQKLLLQYGFRPAKEGSVASTQGVDPARPKIVLPPATTSVTKAALAQWDQIRKPSRVMILFDVSGSMKDNGKLPAAIEAAKANLGNFRSGDIVGLRAFSTAYSGGYEDIRPMKPLGQDKAKFKKQLSKLKPKTGTPLYQVTIQSLEDMKTAAKPGRINAIVLLTDGKDEDNSGFFKLEDVVKTASTDAEQGSAVPVQIFPIRYGTGAANKELDEIATASGGRVFDATDIRRIKTAFAEALSNF